MEYGIFLTDCWIAFVTNTGRRIRWYKRQWHGGPGAKVRWVVRIIWRV